MIMAQRLHSRFRIRLSKYISYLLRHGAEDEGLSLDEHGAADISDLLDKLNEKWRWLSRDHITEIVTKDPKGRFILEDETIRAAYGHSLPVLLKDEPVIPPEYLYHGTSRESAEEILAEGLKPMNRMFVHLSRDEETARNIGERRDEAPVILVIDARRAYESGIPFYDRGSVMLTKEIPPEFIHESDNF